MSSEGASPCFLLYYFLLHWSILSPLQYWFINPLQAKSLTSPYFLKKPQVFSFSHSWVIFHSLNKMQRPIYISQMMLFSKKTYLAVLHRSIICYSPYIKTAVYILKSNWSIQNLKHSIRLNYNVQSAVRYRGPSWAQQLHKHNWGQCNLISISNQKNSARTGSFTKGNSHRYSSTSPASRKQSSGVF